jgi:dienelactone hydrolase
LGLRPGVRSWADRLRQLGYVVHTPDLYDGRIFDDFAEGMRMVERLGGIAALADRTWKAVAALPEEVVYAGFSNGGASAELLAAARPGAQGLVLMHAALPPAAIGVSRWPASVPVQVHYAERDPWRDQRSIDALASSVKTAGASWEAYDYPGAGHLFADPDLPDYDAASAEQMFERVVRFLALVTAHP